ncbi:MAG: FAD-binding oxidoreductase [Nitriliruptorales bacterium]|nr:FAD-binding oxidoreductase [Nitriliruptorales bacterium]
MTSIDDAAWNGLGERIRGAVLRAGDEGYDTARAMWNGTNDKHPAAVVQPTGAADVIACLHFVREHGLPVSVKGGGHGGAGKAVVDDGLVIDLDRMRSVSVDPERRIAVVQGGARLGDMDHETQAFGLATTGGIDSRTGVAGLTLGGGLGYLARKYGLALDNVIGYDVVTADGELVHASGERNEDLYWALRGGGGNFGVVTAFHFQLHEVGPEITVAQNYQPFSAAKEALAFYRDFMEQAPDEVNCLPLIMRVPPAEPFPEEYHGDVCVALVVTHCGELEEGREALQPVVEFGDPILAFADAMPYTALQAAFDEGAPDGARYYGKSQFLSELPDEAIDAILAHVDPLPGPMTMIFFETMGGAINRVAPDATAFPHRDAAYNFTPFGGWEDPSQDDEIKQWARDLYEVVQPWSTGGVYLNYLEGDETERADEAWKGHRDRLAEIKQRWDPDGIFHGAASIRTG